MKYITELIETIDLLISIWKLDCLFEDLVEA
jgi:hypothetical protein